MNNVTNLLAEALRSCITSMKHARVFIQSREKMHPDGQVLHDEDVAKAESALAAYDASLKQGEPSSRWAANGEPDPHGKRYYCERAALACGDMSDDEIANACNIVNLTAMKDRIRWLSRKLATQPIPAEQQAGKICGSCGQMNVADGHKCAPSTSFADSLFKQAASEGRRVVDKLIEQHHFYARNGDLRMTTGDHLAAAKKLETLASTLPAGDEGMRRDAERYEQCGFFLSGPRATNIVVTREEIEEDIARMCNLTGDDPSDYTATPVYLRFMKCPEVDAAIAAQVGK